MSSIRADIGPLSALFAFEAAGRLGSFTRAAGELGVTQAAVSKQITTLEERLGLRLFIRRARHVELSPAGSELFVTTTAALASIARTMRELQAADRPPLTIALSIAMSQFWLMPILPDFTARHPDIPLRILSQDDLEGVAADIVIRFAAQEVPGALRLFEAEVMAMASPRFLERHPLRGAADVLAAPLIHYDTPDRSWIGWREWAAHAGLAPARTPRALSVSRYQDALIAALRDQGVMLTWGFLGRPLIAGGDLVPVPGPRIPAPGAFYLSTRTPERDGVRAVVDWLRRL